MSNVSGFVVAFNVAPNESLSKLATPHGPYSKPRKGDATDSRFDGAVRCHRDIPGYRIDLERPFTGKTPEGRVFVRVSSPGMPPEDASMLLDLIFKDFSDAGLL